MPKRKKIIGVMGSSHGKIPDTALNLAYEVGKEIAKNDFLLLTGGTKGVPEKAVIGAKECGGTCIAISPAIDIEEHESKYNQSVESDIFIFTGIGDFGRNIFNTRTADALVYICGGMGTLSELASAYAEGKLIGVLSNSGGIAEHAKNIIQITGKEPKNEVIYETDAAILIEKLAERLNI